MIKTLIIFIFFTIAFTIQANEFSLGTHFIEVKGSVTKQKEVREYFSFYCPACLRQEPLMKQIAAILPEDVHFIKDHVDGMPGRDIQIEGLLTKALITADILNIKNAVITSVFNYIHKNKSDFATLEEIKGLFLLNDVTEANFDKVFSSFKIA